MSGLVCDSDSEAGREPPVSGNETSSTSSGSNVVSGDDDGPPAKTKKSTVWDSFAVCATDSSKAICNICKAKLSRGRDSKHYNTTSLHNHLYFVHKMKKSSGSGMPSTSPGSTTSQGAGVRVTKRDPPSSSALVTALNAREKWPADHPRSKTITEKIGRMICADLEPFSVVEKDGFKSLVTFLEPKYEIPPRSHFSRTVVPDLYRASRKESAQSLEAAVGGVVNITTDLWSSTHNAHSYMCITGHWCEHVGESVQRKAGLLSVGVLDIEHTADDILSCLKDKLREWEKLVVGQSITVGSVVSDNAADMVRALREYTHLRCVSRTLHLVVTRSLEQDKTVPSLLSKARTISGFIRGSSKASNRLHDLQTQLGLKQRTLITDIKTRWNHSFYMIQRLVEQRRAVQIMAQESIMGQDPTILYPKEWSLASDMITVLAPFEEVTLALSKDSASISEVIPLLHGLCSIVRSLRGDSVREGAESGHIMADDDNRVDAAVGLRQNAPAETRELCAAAKKLAANLSKELENGSEPIFANSTYLLATLLDPRYKTSCFPNSVDVETLKRTLVRRVEESGAQGGAPPAGDVEQTVTPGTSGSSSVFSFLQRKKTAAPMRTQEPLGDVEAYLADRDLSLTDDPVKYWSGKLQCWPNLAQMALHRLSCPPTSVQSERVFSTAGNVVSPRRSNLDPERVEQLVFIKVNEDLKNGIKQI